MNAAMPREERSTHVHPMRVAAVRRRAGAGGDAGMAALFAAFAAESAGAATGSVKEGMAARYEPRRGAVIG
ncbi:hypothetical protein GCM10009748_09510 [Agromyces lapidis]